MSDTQTQRQPTEEELQAYLEQLRGADVAEIVAQAYSMMATGAEVKLGRPDARLLIDALSGLVQATAERVPEKLGEGMRNGLNQLQMAQVQMEGEAARKGSGPEPREESAPDAASSAAQPGSPGAPTAKPRSGQGASQTGTQQGEQSITDRLWIPGRGQ